MDGLTLLEGEVGGRGGGGEWGKRRRRKGKNGRVANQLEKRNSVGEANEFQKGKRRARDH